MSWLRRMFGLGEPSSTVSDMERMVCTKCGGWKDVPVGSFVLMGVRGLEQGSPEAERQRRAGSEIDPFIRRHMERCKPQRIYAYQSDDRGFRRVDPEKRED